MMANIIISRMMKERMEKNILIQIIQILRYLDNYKNKLRVINLVEKLLAEGYNLELEGYEYEDHNDDEQ